MIPKVRIAITGACQMHCIYCPRGINYAMENFSNLDGPPLTTAEILKIAEVMRAHGIVDVHLTGGEPLCRRDVTILVKELSSLGLRVELNTNGILLNGKTAEALKEAGLRLLKISLDAPDRDTFKMITATDYFETVTENIRHAVPIVPVRLNCVVLRRMLDRMIPLIELTGELGAPAIHLLDLTYYDCGGDGRAFWNEEFVDLAAELAPAILARYGGTLRRLPIYGCSFMELSGSEAPTRVVLKEANVSTRSNICAACPMFCHEGVFTLRMSVDGYLNVCPSVNEHGLNALQGLQDGSLARALEWYAELFANSFVHETYRQFLQTQGLCPGGG